MKVLMYGWELPPVYAGGIGMVCYDLLKELSAQNISVTYMMPFGPRDFSTDTGANIVIAENEETSVVELPDSVTLQKIDALFTAYDSEDTYQSRWESIKRSADGSIIATDKKGNNRKLYGDDLFTEVDLFGKRSYEIAQRLDFDVIHAHDWMTFPAAVAAKDASGKPLVVHVHNTIYDRYLGDGSDHEKTIEYLGMERADKIITVSNYVKNMIVTKYGIDPNKVEVVHNAPNSLIRNKIHEKTNSFDLGDDKIVLFTGRMTKQKGPLEFVKCAKRVLEKRKDVKFVMGGSGDMMNQVVSYVNEIGIANKFLFTGFYTMSQGRELYSKADCYIMPSVSEPFGIVPLEAMDLGAPTIITKSSGASEVLDHALKVDHWDIDQMANKVLAVLNYGALKEMLSEHGQAQVSQMNWQKPATECTNIYKNLCGYK